MQAKLTNAALLAVYLLVALSVAEGISRLVLNPVDFLRPKLVEDAILGRRVEPGSAGHDAWGFRNAEVPASAEVVAIGDSLTYGVSATASHSWPARLARLSHKSVYNLGLGSYGPPQYYYLLTTQAIRLKPAHVIVGFYYGNDIADAYYAVYEHDYWRALRNPRLAAGAGPAVQAPNAAAFDDSDRPFAALREWLSYHSMLYRIVTNSSLGDFARFLETTSYGAKKDYTMVALQDHSISTAIDPRSIFIDSSDPKIQEGLRISLELFRRMNDYCKEQNISLAVALIPTKVSVFADYIDSHSLDKILTDEQQIDKTVKLFFDNNHIRYIDTKAALQAAAGQEQLYPRNADVHPNRNGYRIIAEQINDAVFSGRR